MGKTNRLALFIFILGAILFLGLAFSGWVLPNIVQPVAQTIWLFLRIFILSVDQVYYWNVLLIAVVIWVLYRFIRLQSPVAPEDTFIRNEAISNLRNWQAALASTKQGGSDRSITRNKLLQLVISHYAAGQPGRNWIDIQQDLEERRLALPDSVYNFFFPSAGLSPKNPSLVAISLAFHHWYSRISGQEEAAFDRMLDELVDFIKT